MRKCVKTLRLFFFRITIFHHTYYVDEKSKTHTKMSALLRVKIEYT
jgi:hypothetical protein